MKRHEKNLQRARQKELDNKRMEERKEFVGHELPLAKHRASSLGLWRTFHALDEASKLAGWELAELLTQEAAKDGN